MLSNALNGGRFQLEFNQRHEQQHFFKREVNICLLFLSATIPHKIPETFLCFSMASIHEKENEARLLSLKVQKHPPRGVLKERYSENMQQIYRRTHMPKCDFNKVAN